MGHEADDAEDDEAREDAGAAVADGHHDGVPEDVVVELVVGGEGDHHPPGDAQREEDLGAGVGPDPDVCQPLPLGREVEGDPVHVAGQGGGPHQQDHQDQVGEQGRHVDRLHNTVRRAFI